MALPLTNVSSYNVFVDIARELLLVILETISLS